MHVILDALTVAISFSDPQADRGALDFAGAVDIFFFLEAAFFKVLVVMEHGLHSSFLGLALPMMTSQPGFRSVTVDGKWSRLSNLGMECQTTAEFK